jgi:hypothetical protein
MDTSMEFYVGHPISLIENLEWGYAPPSYEIGRALVHYRNNVFLPIPSLMQTKFLYYEEITGRDVKIDEGTDWQLDTYTKVVLCDSEGNELQEYLFSTFNRMKVIKK